MGKCSCLVIWETTHFERILYEKKEQSETLDLAERSVINFLISMTDVKYLNILVWKSLFILGRCSMQPLQAHEDVCRNLKHINSRIYPSG